MIDNELETKGVKLPLSDWILIITYTICFPVFCGSIIILIGYFTLNALNFFFFLGLISLISILIVGNFFLRSYNELRSYALQVCYYHFVPTWRDFVLNLINQVFQIVLFLFILSFVLNFIINIPLHLMAYFILALLFSLAFQSIIVFLSMRKKQELLATAQESIKPEIAEHLAKNHPNSHQISQFRFADIQVASLFLSAGVMTYGLSHICLISRYFNWKLSDTELIAVLGHEEGHIARKHPKKQYMILGMEGIMRTFRIFYIIVYIVMSKEIFSTLFFQIVFFSSAFFPILISGLLTIMQHYRRYLQEIRADQYAGQLVGNIEVANALKKLPNVIPAPISPGQTDFLGFRISLLRYWDKNKRVNPE